MRGLWKYSIPGRVSDFLVTPLGQPKPTVDGELTNGFSKFEKIDIQQCRLWITKRAYELGWNSELFHNDGSGSNYSRFDNDLERIGKKYQRIALDEIQARLADNFWILEGWPEQPSVYRYSNNDFRRNIEPTILPSDAHLNDSDQSSKDWIVKPVIILPEVTEEHLKQWPFEEDPTVSMVDKLSRVDESGRQWRLLYELNINNRNTRNLVRVSMVCDMRSFDFFIACLLIRVKQKNWRSTLKHSKALMATLSCRRNLQIAHFCTRLIGVTLGNQISFLSHCGKHQKDVNMQFQLQATYGKTI